MRMWPRPSTTRCCRPELDDEFITDGCELSRPIQGCIGVRCVARTSSARRSCWPGRKSRSVTVIGFPHGSTTTEVKLFEAEQAMRAGASELDMVINIGALRSGRDAYVKAEIAAIVETAHRGGAIVKVILENAYLDERPESARMPTGRGCRADFRQDVDWLCSIRRDPRRPRPHAANGCRRKVGVKAAGGVRTLDGLLAVMELGVTRIGATQTAAILDEFKSRKQRPPAR